MIEIEMIGTIIIITIIEVMTIIDQAQLTCTIMIITLTIEMIHMTTGIIITHLMILTTIDVAKIMTIVEGIMTIEMTSTDLKIHQHQTGILQEDQGIAMRSGKCWFKLVSSCKKIRYLISLKFLIGAQYLMAYTLLNSLNF